MNIDMILRVTPEGEFIWHPEADRLIAEGKFPGYPGLGYVLKALRKAEPQQESKEKNMSLIAAKEFEGELWVKASNLSGLMEELKEAKLYIKELEAQSGEAVAEVKGRMKGYCLTTSLAWNVPMPPIGTKLYLRAPQAVPEELVESVAKTIYMQWRFMPEYRPWVEGGNSLKQDKARSLAHAAIEMAAAPSPACSNVASDLEGEKE